MSATTIHAMGYDVVPIIPPGAKLSPKSKINPLMLGKIPGRKGRSGWYGYPFLEGGVTPKQIDDWGAGVGVLAANTPGLDIDVDDAELSAQIVKAAEAHFGPAPVRLSREPRRLMVYRTETPFPKVRLSWGEHAVEFLGSGRQYIVEGTHPSGAEYRWDGRSLSEWEAGGLSIVTPGQVEAFFANLRAALEKMGHECKLSGRTSQSADAPPQEELEAPNPDELERIVSLIPNPGTNGWDEMVAMGYAIKAAGGDDARDDFLDWCSRWDGPNDEYENEINWASFHGPFRAGWNWLCEQAGVSTAADDFDIPEDAPPPPPPTSEQVQFSDEEMVARIQEQIKASVRYIPSDKQWLTWEGHRWVRDGRLTYEDVIRKALWRESLMLMSRAKAAPTSKEGAPYAEAARKYQSSAGISAVVRLLRARLSAEPADFDVDPLRLNTPGGVVDLTDGSMKAPHPDLMMSRSTGVAPLKGATPMWDRFLQDLTGGDREFINYLQRMAGYALTGDMSEKKLWFLWGSSDTGKSTFVNVLKGIFGDYEKPVDASTFISNYTTNDGGNNTALAALVGARLVTATEPSVGQTWDEKRVKAITGDDSIRCRHLYGHHFEYNPQFKIVIVGNHEPEIRLADDAMLGRINILPLVIKVPEERKVGGLADILLRREGPQILQWMIKGALLWAESGLKAPDVVLQKNADYEDAEDTFGQWLSEECEFGPEFSASRQSLYNAYALWSKARGEQPGGSKAFRRLAEAKRLPITNAQIGARRLRGYKGIRLNNDHMEIL